MVLGPGSGCCRLARAWPAAPRPAGTRCRPVAVRRAADVAISTRPRRRDCSPTCDRPVAPMPVYGLAENFPEGATVPAEWWPVVELDRPADYDGSGDGQSAGLGRVRATTLRPKWSSTYQARLARHPRELPRRPGRRERSGSGSVGGGTPATSTRSTAGDLVQWSDGGPLVRGLRAGCAGGQIVVEVALGMQAHIRWMIRSEQSAVGIGGLLTGTSAKV